MSRQISNRLAWGIILPVLLGFFLILQNKTAVQDWLYFLSYEPPERVKILAEESGMNEEGRRLFYRADPELASKTVVSELCLGADNLGCLVTGPKIYILNYDQNENDVFNQAIVTGAHEMLHMAFFRLSEEEQDDLRRVLDQALSRLSNTRIFNVLESTRDELEYYDEAYALLGTEVENLPWELEAHYNQFFEDRSKVIEAFEKSKGLL